MNRLGKSAQQRAGKTCKKPARQALHVLQDKILVYRLRSKVQHGNCITSVSLVPQSCRADVSRRLAPKEKGSNSSPLDCVCTRDTQAYSLLASAVAASAAAFSAARASAAATFSASRRAFSCDAAARSASFSLRSEERRVGTES